LIKQASGAYHALHAIEEAFKHIEDGDYGYCISCDEEIAPKRLELNPAVQTCINFLKKVTPSKDLLNFFEAVVGNKWQDISKQRQQMITNKEHKKFELSDRIKKYLDYIVETTNNAVRKHYEAEVESASKELDLLEEELRELYSTPMTHEDSVRTVFQFL